MLQFSYLFYLIQTYVDNIELYKPVEIKVYGNNFIPKKEIITIVNKIITNNSILKIDIKNIQNKINSSSYIEMSRVYISLPSIVNVEIKEIRPIALFQDNDNNIFTFSNVLMKILEYYFMNA